MTAEAHSTAGYAGVIVNGQLLAAIGSGRILRTIGLIARASSVAVDAFLPVDVR